MVKLGKGTPYLMSEVPLLSREYSPRKPTVRSFYPHLSISALSQGYLKLHYAKLKGKESKQGCAIWGSNSGPRAPRPRTN